MDVSHYIALRKDDDYPLLFAYLQQHDVEYSVDDPFIILTILESNPHWDNILKLLKMYNCFTNVTMIYTEEERLAAEWMTVRSKWHYDYPQPEDEYEDIVYDKTDYCEHCHIGLIQKEPFRMKRTPKWGRRGFAMVNWLFEDLFVSEDTKNKLEQSGLTGFSFWNVKNKSGKEFLQDFYQIKFEVQVPPGLCEESSNVAGVVICPVCGRTKYNPRMRGQYMFKKEIFEDAPDIVRTSDYIGWIPADRMLLINQKMYRFIKDQKMDRSLVFEPVILV